MSKTFGLAGVALLLTLIAGAAMAAEPLVDTGWVRANLGKPGILFLDITGNSAAYAKGHVPGAVFTDYTKDKWRVDGKSNGKKVSGLLPPVADLEKLFGRLGIGNGDHVVILPAGTSAAEFGTATRIYWTLKVLGHDGVSIMNGGMAAWMADKANPLQTAAVAPAATTYKASFRPELLATADEVRAALSDGTVLIDSRPTDQYLGINKSGAVLAYGTIPGAVSVPAIYSTVDGGGVLRGENSLKRLYAMTGAPTAGKAIAFCNTGHWASLGWFINSEILGDKDTAMYDGSMAEWTTRDDAAMERKVSLD